MKNKTGLMAQRRISHTVPETWTQTMRAYFSALGSPVVFSVTVVYTIQYCLKKNICRRHSSSVVGRSIIHVAEDSFKVICEFM